MNTGKVTITSPTTWASLARISVYSLASAGPQPSEIGISFGRYIFKQAPALVVAMSTSWIPLSIAATIASLFSLALGSFAPSPILVFVPFSSVYFIEELIGSLSEWINGVRSAGSAAIASVPTYTWTVTTSVPVWPTPAAATFLTRSVQFFALSTRFLPHG